METSSLAPTTTQCDACFKNVTDDDAFCPDCGYPLKGTAMEQKTFIAQQENLDLDLGHANKQIKTAGHTLFYVAAIFALSGILVFVLKKDDTDVAALAISDFVLAILFLVLGEFSKKKPLACIISGISLYVIVQLLNLVADPTSIARGIWVKGIIIGFLVKGIKSALEIEKIKKENNIA